MQVIIKGKNRAEHIKIKRGDEEKHFVRTRGQLYMVMPDGLTRCIRTKYGKRIADEEVIVYSENATIPYDTGSNVCYDPSMLLGRINLEKDIVGTNLYGKKGIAARTASDWYREITKYLPFAIAGIVLAYAYLG